MTSYCTLSYITLKMKSCQDDLALKKLTEIGEKEMKL